MDSNCAMSQYDLDVTFVFDPVTLNVIIWSGNRCGPSPGWISGTIRWRKVGPGGRMAIANFVQSDLRNYKVEEVQTW